MNPLYYTIIEYLYRRFILKYLGRRYDSLTSLSQILEKVTKRKLPIKFNNKFAEFQIINNWEKIVGSKIAPYCQPQFLNSSTLYVNTITSVWANELSYMKETIILNINQFLRKNSVSNIYFRAGEVFKTKEKYIGPSEMEEVTLTPEEKDNALKPVEILDGEMKEVMSRLIIKSMKRRKIKNELNDQK